MPRITDGRPSGGPALLRLMTWMSPGFPVGAFAHSHGLECAIDEHRVRDVETLVSWVTTLLSDGSGWNDLVLFSEAFHAARAGNASRFRQAGELSLALAGSMERRQETLALGRAFLLASAPWRLTVEGAIAKEEAMTYPVAVAERAANSAIPLEDALLAYAHGFAANLVAAATRLVPLGQGDAVAALHRLEQTILTTAARAGASTLDDLGSAAILSEIAAMRHETLATRLFRS